MGGITMNLYNEAKNELRDDLVIKKLSEAKELYEDGAIIECQDILIDIVNAITQFTQDN